MTHRLDSIRCYHSGPEWTWERWQWRGTPHSPKLKHHWKLTIILFIVIPGHTWVGLTPPQRSNRCILEPQPTGQLLVATYFFCQTMLRFIWFNTLSAERSVLCLYALQKEKTLSQKKGVFPEYKSKLQLIVRLLFEIYVVWSTLSLTLLPGLFCLGDKVTAMVSFFGSNRSVQKLFVSDRTMSKKVQRNNHTKM